MFTAYLYHFLSKDKNCKKYSSHILTIFSLLVHIAKYSWFWQMCHIITSDAVQILTVGEIKRRRNDRRRGDCRRHNFQRNECDEMNSRRNDRRRNGREPFS